MRPRPRPQNCQIEIHGHLGVQVSPTRSKFESGCTVTTRWISRRRQQRGESAPELVSAPAESPRGASLQKAHHFGDTLTRVISTGCSKTRGCRDFASVQRRDPIRQIEGRRVGRWRPFPKSPTVVHGDKWHRLPRKPYPNHQDQSNPRAGAQSGSTAASHFPDNRPKLPFSPTSKDLHKASFSSRTFLGAVVFQVHIRWYSRQSPVTFLMVFHRHHFGTQSLCNLYIPYAAGSISCPSLPPTGDAAPGMGRAALNNNRAANLQ